MNIEEALKLGLKISEQLPTYDVPVDLIDPDLGNINHMDDDKFNRLVEEMENNGCIVPVQITPYPGEKFRLVGGEHRWRGAISLGWRTIPANILLGEQFQDDDMRHFIMVRLNVLSGKASPTKFTAMYTEKAQRYGSDQLRVLMGYTETGTWKRLTQGAAKAISRSGVIKGASESTVTEEITKRVGGTRSADSLSRVIAKMMQEQIVKDKHHAIFTHDGASHHHVAMDDRMHAAMMKLQKYADIHECSFGDVLAQAIDAFLEENA